MKHDEAVKHIQTSASERIKQIKQMLGSFRIFLGKIVPNGLRPKEWQMGLRTNEDDSTGLCFFGCVRDFARVFGAGMMRMCSKSHVVSSKVL